jgi:hypothetical protein
MNISFWLPRRKKREVVDELRLQQTKKLRAFANIKKLIPKYKIPASNFFGSQNFVIDDFVICDRIL